MIRRFIKKFFEWDGIAPGDRGFIQAALMAAPYILSGLSALGGVFGKQRKYIDPDMMRQKYGPQAIAGDTNSLANFILNSPYGQQLLKGAATSGQEMQTDLAQRAAASGMAPGAGGTSGASDFAAAAAPQIQGNLERQTKAGVWQAALPVAAGMNENLANMAEYQSENPIPSAFQKISAGAGAAASVWPQATAAKKPGERQ